MMAPMPAAARMAPPASGLYPERRIIGQATAPSITVLATPLPDTAPNRYPAIVTVRPGPAPRPERPTAAIATSMKKRPAPLCSSIAP